MKHRGTLIVIWLAMMTLTGCMSLFHPQATEIYNQAKGPNAQQTTLTLVGLMETSAQQAKTEHGESQGLETLHNQFHALHKSFCDFSEQQRATTPYEQAVTLNKELKAVFHRLWKFKNDTPLRTVHLDLMLSRIRELHSVLQAIPG
ncbi:MAG: hypothetical protein AB7P17_10395 [Nitrospirales bacterium]|nr:hypothetical protein [Nitrospirales bacterium]